MKILLALDHSECSQLAVESVLSRKWSEGTAFRLVHVLEPFNPIEANANISPEQWSCMVDVECNRRRIVAERMLQSAVSRLTSTHPRCEVTTCLSESDMADQSIVDIACEWMADLIVLGSHSRRGLNRLLLGSVANSVLLNAPCAVEIVKAQKTAQVCETFNVLLALDDSRFSEAAFLEVLRRPWTENTEFKLVTVIKTALDACIGVDNAVSVLGILSDEAQSAKVARAGLAAKAAQLREQLKPCNIAVDLMSGDPRDTLLQLIEDWPAHLVVLGSHGRTGLGRLFLGSVSQAIALHARCSVEIVKLRVSDAAQKDRERGSSVSAKLK
ncbi:MAG: universal stress protein [Candidatus Obscuribacter sp.]|nr:universal stress protein [Candidatus Obscuribacter sp.]